MTSTQGRGVLWRERIWAIQLGSVIPRSHRPFLLSPTKMIIAPEIYGGLEDNSQKGLHFCIRKQAKRTVASYQHFWGKLCVIPFDFGKIHFYPQAYSG